MPAARLLVVARAGGDAGEAGRAAAVTRSLPGTGSVLRFGLRGAGPQPGPQPGPQLHEVRTGQARQRPGVAGQPAEELAPEAEPVLGDGQRLDPAVEAARLAASARIRHAKIHAASGRVQSSEWDDLPGRREYS